MELHKFMVESNQEEKDTKESDELVKYLEAEARKPKKKKADELSLDEATRFVNENNLKIEPDSGSDKSQILGILKAEKIKHKELNVRGAKILDIKLDRKSLKASVILSKFRKDKIRFSDVS